MGLLLRERIVFLGVTQIDDFVADAAIVSQLLLLHPHNDIRLFINSTGGSLRAPKISGTAVMPRYAKNPCESCEMSRVVVAIQVMF